MEYIFPIEKTTLFNGGYVQLWDFKKSNTCEQSRIKTVSTVANCVFGQNGKIINAEKLYDKMKKQAALNTPGRPFEFVPVICKLSIFDRLKLITNHQFYRYGLIVSHRGTTLFYTNLRNHLKHLQTTRVLNSISSYECNEETFEKLYSNFVVFKLKVPMFVRDQLMTHTGLSKINQSNRVGKNEKIQFYIPADFKNKLYQFFLKQKDSKVVAHTIKNLSTVETFNRYILSSGIEAGQKLLHSIGYPKELYSRFPNQLKYGIMWIAGWINDPNAWKNLFLQRNALQEQWKNWTQYQTHQYVKAMKELVDKFKK